MPSDPARDDRWRLAVDAGEADRDGAIDDLVAQAHDLTAALRKTLTDAQDKLRQAIRDEGDPGESRG